MVSLQLSLLIILTMQSYKFYKSHFVHYRNLFNPFASGIQKVFLDPITGLFSVKIRKKFLAIKNFSVNDTMSGQPNKRVPSDSEKHRRVYMSSNVCHSHEWRVDTASGKTLKKRNACLHAVRQAVEKKIACIYGLRSEGVKDLVSFLYEIILSFQIVKVQLAFYVACPLF